MCWNRTLGGGNSPTGALLCHWHTSTRSLLNIVVDARSNINGRICRHPGAWDYVERERLIDDRSLGLYDVGFLRIHRLKVNFNIKTTDFSLTAEMYERIGCCEVRRHFPELWHELQWRHCICLRRTDFPKRIDRLILIGESPDQDISQKTTVVWKPSVYKWEKW